MGIVLQEEYFLGGAKLPHPSTVEAFSPWLKAVPSVKPLEILAIYETPAKVPIWRVRAGMARPTFIVTLLLALGLVAVLIAVAVDRGRFKLQAARGPADDSVVATVAGRSIGMRQIESAVSLPLYVLETQRRQLLLQAIQNQIDQQLLEAEASHKGLTVHQLIDQASRSESISRMADLPGPVTPMTVPGQQAMVDAQEEARIRQALIVSLRRKADIRITLPPLELPPIPVSPDDDPALGPEHAPVTIVEFSDFQCPFCQRSVAVLKQLRLIYGDKIRLVYRDFPGENHPGAFPAAEASECAHEQGKFWEYHDLLFERQTPDKAWNFLQLAKESGLDPQAFSGCMTSGRFRAEVNKDLEDGLRIGITSTPTFFINGRPLVGAQPISAFQDLINQALADHTQP